MRRVVARDSCCCVDVARDGGCCVEGDGGCCRVKEAGDNDCRVDVAGESGRRKDAVCRDIAAKIASGRGDEGRTSLVGDETPTIWLRGFSTDLRGCGFLRVCVEVGVGGSVDLGGGSFFAGEGVDWNGWSFVSGANASLPCVARWRGMGGTSGTASERMEARRAL